MRQRLYNQFPLHLAGLFLAVAIFASCGERVTGPSASLEIVSPHPTDDGVIRWDPNEEPILQLAIPGDILASGDADAIVWRQEGWQVDDSHWRGTNLRVHVDLPGCGYGGHDFVITATTPDMVRQASVTVWMEPYICPGSPWLTE